MRPRHYSRLFNIVLFIAMFLILSRRTEAAAKLETLSFPSFYLSKSVSRTYTEYDFTGDGVKDRVVISGMSTRGIAGEIGKITVKVNGKTAWTWNNGRFNEGITLKLCTLNNGKVYFFVKGSMENLDAAVCTFLRYVNGKFKVIQDCTTGFAGGAYCIGEPVSVSGNTITYEAYKNTDAMGDMKVRYQFRYSNGALRLKSKTGEILKFLMKSPDKYFTLAKKVSLYKTTTTKSPALTLAAGTKVRITHIYMSGKKTVRFKLTAQNGKSGWVNGNTYITVSRYGRMTKAPIIREFSYVA